MHSRPTLSICVRSVVSSILALPVVSMTMLAISVAWLALSMLASSAMPRPVLADIVVNEIRYDYHPYYRREFVELKGTSGASLDGYMLVGIDGANGMEYRTIDLSGYSIPADGYFVVGMSGVSESDLFSDDDWQDGPDAIELRSGSTVVDAVCYGSSANLTCEGTAAEDVESHAALARCPDGTDTNDNSADFVIDPLGSPGAPNDPWDGTCNVGAYGACCLPCDCFLATYEQCSQFGSYEGDGTNCVPVPCSSCPPGACCFSDGSCLILNEIECSYNEGEFQGSFILCDPNPCPQPEGACCLPDCDGCVEVTYDLCVFTYGGEYIGDDVPCAPDPCDCTEFACCLDDGTCEELTATECAARGGEFRENQSCDEVVCEPVPIRHSTWGELKRRFRS